MEMRLDPTPYAEPYSHGKIRFLFEMENGSGSVDKSALDFYLYVWIEQNRRLAGFQVVLDETFVVDFHPPSQLDFVRINADPIERTARDLATKTEKKYILNCVNNFTHAQLPKLMQTISAIMRGTFPASLDLAENEAHTLEQLTK
jgi:hypothetical protein